MKDDKTKIKPVGKPGRKPSPPHLKKIRFNTRIPSWLKDWLLDESRHESAPVLIEEALVRVHKLKPPKKGKWYDEI